VVLLQIYLLPLFAFRGMSNWAYKQCELRTPAYGRCCSLMGQGQQLDFEGDVVGCLCSLRARMALDGVSWVRSGLVEIAVGLRIGRMLQHRRHHPLPPSDVAPA
jgi:hypothetical protein